MRNGESARRGLEVGTEVIVEVLGTVTGFDEEGDPRVDTARGGSWAYDAEEVRRAHPEERTPAATEPKKQTVLEMIEDIDARRDRLMAEEREEVRQRRVDLAAARLFANGSTATEAYAAADILEEAREAFIAGRKAGT